LSSSSGCIDLSGGVLEEGIECVEVRIWRLDVEDELGVLEVFFRVDERGGFEGFADFEVGFAVEVLGLDVADAVWVGGGEDDLEG
jgi:hypothetical protein